MSLKSEDMQIERGWTQGMSAKETKRATVKIQRQRMKRDLEYVPHYNRHGGGWQY